MYLDHLVQKASKAIWDYPEPLAYLKKRGLSEDDMRRYGVGYLKIANLPKEDSYDYQHFYRETNQFRYLQNKLIFPLRNIHGKVNGVVTRDLAHKRYTQFFLPECSAIGGFFGLFEALPHIWRTKRVFVHEGAFDAISFGKVFPNTVASITSFLNERQYELLMFFVKKIILIYDKDSAGYTGLKKAHEEYGEQHIDHVFIGDQDSNACLQVMGLERFQKYIRSRIPILYQE